MYLGDRHSVGLGRILLVSECVEEGLVYVVLLTLDVHCQGTHTQSEQRLQQDRGGGGVCVLPLDEDCELLSALASSLPQSHPFISFSPALVKMKMMCG